jgi:hypothetical protein
VRRRFRPGLALRVVDDEAAVAPAGATGPPRAPGAGALEGQVAVEGVDAPAWARTQREVGEQQRQLQAITEDQGRLRANLREVPQSSPLHKRYLEKLGKQEDEVEKYRAEIKRLQEQEHEQKKALDDFLASFSAE